MSMQRHSVLIHRARLGFAAASLAALTFAATACTQSENRTSSQPQAGETTTEQQTAQQETNTNTTGDVARKLDDLVGQTVTIRGEVDEPVSQNAIKLEGKGVFGGQDVLVALPAGVTVPGEDNKATNDIQVTGEVRQLTADTATQLNLNIPADKLSDYEGKPVIVAQSVAMSPSPQEISDRPEAFYNKSIAIEGDLEEVAPNTYKLKGDGVGGGDILVLSSQAVNSQASAQSNQSNQNGQDNQANNAPANGTGTTGDDSSSNTQQADNQDLDDVVVTGEVRPFNLSELQQQYNWNTEQQQQLEQDYANKPVIVADSVNPVDD